MRMREIRQKTYQIEGIPILEMNSEETNNHQPILFLFHGWTSCKENMIDFAKTMAKSHYRIIMPDCAYHGERKKNDFKMWDIDLMFETIIQTVDEFQILLNHFSELENNHPKFAVAGVSMGALIVHALMRKYDCIPAGIVLMGSPSICKLLNHFVNRGMQSLVDASHFFYPNEEVPSQQELLNITIEKEKILLEMQEKVKPYDLASYPKIIKERPMYIWHGMKDLLIPYVLTSDFEQEIKHLEEAKNLMFSYDEKQGHLVPLYEIKKVTKYLEYLREIQFDKKRFNRNKI